MKVSKRIECDATTWQAIEALKGPLSFPQFFASDTRVVAWREANNVPEPVRQKTGPKPKIKTN